MNCVTMSLKTSFNLLSREDQSELISLGPHQPPNYKYTYKDGKKNRHITHQSFKTFPWLTVDTEKNRFYCFNCLLFANRTISKDKSSWFRNGFSTYKHLNDRAKKHGKSAEHLNSSTKLKLFG